MNKTPARGKPERELENERQYRINRQESLTRDFSSEKGGKPQEYFVYFKVFRTNFWRKRSVRIRRRICAVLPKQKETAL